MTTSFCGWGYFLVVVMVAADFDGVVFRDRGYEVTVTIRNDVPQDKCRVILENLQDVFKNASRALFRATKDLSFFRSVKVVIPKHWDVGECARGISFTTGTLPWVHTLRGFQVGPPTPRNGDLPSTLQPWGCGHPGHHIYLPFTYFLGEAGLGFGDPGRILVREWAKYRYGVFEEAGYPQDPLYPSYFTPYLESGPEMEAPTGCSNGHVKGNRICSGDSCHFLPDNKGSNDDITSSLMSYLPILPNVEDFCDEKNHNADAPTQHNALCSGKSTWEIISSHPDFSQNPVPLMGKPPDPKFEFVKSQARKVFLLLDASSGGNVQLDQNRWEWTRSSVYRFLELLSHDPEQVELSLAHFALEMEEVPPLSPVNTFGLSNPRLVSRYPSANRTACIGCALDKIAQIIQEGSMKGAEVILLTRNAYLDRHDIAMADWDRMESVLASFDTVIHSVSADGQDQSEVRLRRRSVLSDLVRGSGGRELHLDMTGDVTDMVAILNALEALVTPHSSFKVMEEVGSPSQYGKVRGRFMLDPSLTTATFTAYYGQEPRDVKVTSPSGRVLSQSPRLQAHYHAYIIDIPTIDMEEGMWEYQVDAFSMDRVGIEIRAKADPETEISLRGSTSWDHIQIPDPQVRPLMIYAELWHGTSPVLNATVTARLTRKSADVTDDVIVPLTDDGQGDPDITRGDGVYSGYFVRFHPAPASYTVQLEASSGPMGAKVYLASSPGTVPCCGSGPTEGQNMTSVGIFKRRSFGGRFFLESPPTEDVFPPNKVIDLRVTPDPENGVFVLAWTAPGGDYNMGRAARYELKYARDRESLNDEKFPSAVLLPTPTPATAGSKEVFRVDIDADGLAYNTLYYFAIRSLHGQYSEISNPVAGFIIRPTTVAPATVPYPTNDPWTTHNTLGLSRTQFIGVVIGCVGFLILVLVFTMFYFLVMSRQKSKFHEDDDSSMAGESGMTQEKSEPDLIRPPTMKARGHVTVINTGELNGGFVAPQFVPASQILEEHERRKSSSSYTNLRSQEAIYANYRPTSKTNGHMVPNGHLPNGYHDRVSVQSGQQSESTASVRSDPTGGQPQGISLVGCRRGSFDDQGHTGTSRSPPVIPPKPYTKGLFFTPSSSLNDSHSSGGSDKKIWTATQV